MADGDTIGIGRPVRVCIDPGHGGRDNGAYGNGVVEKQVNLDVSLALQGALVAAGHEVRMTRTTDTYVGLTARGCFSVKNDCDLFVSVHHDWLSDAGRRGCSSFVRYESYLNGFDLGSNITRALNDEWQHGFTYGTECQKHWVNLGVLRGCNNDGLVTATVVECGCLTNPEDAANAKRDDYAERTASAILTGINGHLGIDGVEPPQGAEQGPLMVVDHETGLVVWPPENETWVVVENGNHIDDEDQTKVYARKA